MRKTRMSIALLAGAVSCVLVASAALAATITGTDRGEHLVGTARPDTIYASGGNDRVDALAGNDTVYAGWGRDRVRAGAGNDLVYGGWGNDRLVGGTGDDTQYGGPGNDLILANQGVDHSYGGPGNDRLWALARGDVHPGPNGEVDTIGDTVDGGPGDDRIHTRDGEVDTVTCGDGYDVAFLDKVDVISDATSQNPNGSCEVVKRADPKPSDAAAEPDNGQGGNQP
jgi:Ca2+-binding RTX toxin-like protein